MARLIIETPVRLRIEGLTAEERQRLEMSLTYTDQKITFELQKHRHSSWFMEKYGQEAWQDKFNDLKSRQKKCLLFQDLSAGCDWTYSGLAEKVSGLLGDIPVESLVKYRDDGALGWDHRPEYEMYPYQEGALQRLLEHRHAGVEIGTGLGKSFIILNLVKELGLRTVIMAPSVSIADRLYKDCVHAFGSKKVGFFGAGKKKPKMITVGVAASFTRVEEGSPEWKLLADADVFIADESHQCPAATLSKVCFGLMEKASYRFFFSATQLRQDGLDLLLDAITGPIVYTMTVRQGIDQGYLAKLHFTMVSLDSDSSFEDRDANEMTRKHLYYNDRVVRAAAQLINLHASYDQQVLVLVEELEQFTKLYPLLKYPVKFAHGGVSADNKDKLPKLFHDSDPIAFVEEFNRGEFPILVGTSCVSTGTDIKANEVTVNLQGGKSMIAVMQGPSGRSTRLFDFKPDRAFRRTPGKKTDCQVIDFDVQNIETTHRHADERRRIYDSIYGPTRTVNYANH
jgi:superfamily II DNA or RNA helicase